MNKILVVDDETEIVDQVKEFFEDEGFLVLTAETGDVGIKLIGKESPDILILDMKLPDMSGLRVLKYARAESPTTKIIVITGYIDQMMFDQAEEVGRDIFLQKPFDLERLKFEVDKLIAAKEG